MLERGTGCSAALSILYLEVCARLGYQLQARVLDDRRYVVLAPPQQAGHGASVSEQTQGFVVDAYGGGDLLRVEEVR